MVETAFKQVEASSFASFNARSSSRTSRVANRRGNSAASLFPFPVIFPGEISGKATNQRCAKYPRILVVDAVRCELVSWWVTLFSREKQGRSRKFERETASHARISPRCSITSKHVSLTRITRKKWITNREANGSYSGQGSEPLAVEKLGATFPTDLTEFCIRTLQKLAISCFTCMERQP